MVTRLSDGGFRYGRTARTHSTTPIIDRSLVSRAQLHYTSPRSAPRLSMIVGILSVCSMLAASAWFLAPTGDPFVQRNVASISYTVHTVISINGDPALAAKALSEGWPGDGSSSNPYIIDGYDIDGAGFLSTVLVGNTTLHFIVQNCYLHDGVSGVFFYNVANGDVVNCIFASDTVSIRLANSRFSALMANNGTAVSILAYGCDNLTAEDNNCSWGGYLSVSGTSMLIRNNSCSHNSGISASGFATRNVTITGNVCRYDSWGISCISGAMVTVANNTCTDNSVAGIYAQNSNPTIRGNNCSRSAIGIKVDTGGATITDNNCSDTTGAGIDYSGISGTIVRNDCLRGTIGIKAFAIGSTKANISNNVCSQNSLAGIDVSGLSLDSARGTIGNNTCSDNLGPGIQAAHFGGLILNNTCQMNGCDGILLQHSSSSTVRENTVAANGCFGMRFTYIFHLMDGYRYSTYDTIAVNTVRDNSLGGILLDHTDHETLTGNSFSSNSKLGLLVNDSTYVTMRLNSMTDEGVFMSGSAIGYWCLHDIDSSNLVNGRPIFYLVNAISGTVASGQGQVIMGNCRNIAVQHQILSNATVAVSLGYCRNINVTDTYCSGGIFGMNLNSSTGCWIHENEIKNNSDYGVNISKGSANMVWNNTFYGNNLATSVYSPSHVQARDDSNLDSWDRNSRGNWWNDWQSPDSNSDGIVDVPYAIDGGAGAVDNFPLTTPVSIPEFGGMAVVALSALTALMVMVWNRRRNR